MSTVVIAAAASSTSSPAAIPYATGPAVWVRQWADFTEATCTAAGSRLRRTVSERREALELRMQEFVLELLAAIVLIAIFMIVTETAAGEGN
jgi:hypothetical protein